MPRRETGILVLVMSVAAGVSACSSVEAVRDDFAVAESRGGIADYQEFLRKHPDGDYAAWAKQRIIEVQRNRDWSNAMAANTIEAYQAFIGQYPQSLQAEQARGKIKSLDWQQATKSNSIAGYEAFLQKYPGTSEAISAQSAIGRLVVEQDWQAALSTNTEASLQSFVTSHPKSAHVREAYSRIGALREQQAWNEAMHRNTKAGWDDFVARYSHAGECKEALARLNALKGNKPDFAPTEAQAITLRGLLSVNFSINFFGDGTGVVRDEATGELVLSSQMKPVGWTLSSHCRQYKVVATKNTKVSDVVGTTQDGQPVMQLDGSAIYRVKGRLHEGAITATEVIRE